MAQNTSTAVMQRRSEPHDSLDYFPTPPWATRALCEFLKANGYSLDRQVVWEPACGSGHMFAPLAEYFAHVFATDIMEYEWEVSFGRQEGVGDFLFPNMMDLGPVEWVITNPPFKLAEQFIARASQVAKTGFAMLVRTAFLEGVGRYNKLFSVNPPSYILQFTERVPMQKGSLDKDLSSATAYCWLVWIDGEYPPKFDWIAPCRKQLERDSDYPCPEQEPRDAPLLDVMEAGL